MLFSLLLEHLFCGLIVEKKSLVVTNLDLLYPGETTPFQYLLTIFQYYKWQILWRWFCSHWNQSQISQWLFGSKVKVLYFCKKPRPTLSPLNTSEILLAAKNKKCCDISLQICTLKEDLTDFLIQWGQQNPTKWKCFSQTFNLKC